MKYMFFVLSLLACTETFAQNTSKRTVMIDITETASGVEERSTVAMKCTRIASAAVYAHARGKLMSVMNEAAKVKNVGSSDDPFFKTVIDIFKIDAEDDALFPGLMLAQLDIMWLEERSRYKAEAEPVFTAYAAASCARVAKLQPST